MGCAPEFPDPSSLGAFDLAELGLSHSSSWEERYRAMVSPLSHPAALAHVDNIRARIGWSACTIDAPNAGDLT